MLRLEWAWMVVYGEDVVNVAVHGQPGGTCCIVPRNVNTGKFGSCPISSDGVVFLQGRQEVICVVTANILYTKIINNEGESNGTPSVAPETWGSLHLVVSMLV